MIKKIHKPWIATRLAIKLTIILLVSFYAIIWWILWAQYYYYHQEEVENFTTNANLFQSNILKWGILEKDNFTQKIDDSNSNFVFEPFDNNGNNLSDTVIIDKKTQKILVNEFLYLTDENVANLVRMEKWVTINMGIENLRYNFFRFDTEKYIIIYTTTSSTFKDYYEGIFQNSSVISWLTLTLFSVIAFYFSRLIIKPVQQQNNSLAIYNKNLAHELKTPLSIIHTNLDMLELTHEPKFIASSKEEIKHIEEIIDSLLFLVKTNNDNPNYEIGNIFTSIDEISKKFAKIAIHYGDINTEVEKHFDKKLFQILIENILENASKYAMEKYVTIEITENFMSFTNPIEKNFTKKELKQIQEVFYQLDTSRHSRGYWLGIPMVKKITEIFEWDIKFYSKNNTFQIKIFY